MNSRHINKIEFSAEDMASLDPRIQKAIKGWRIEENYKGQTVHIPGTWNSVIYPYRYFQAIKKPGDNNPGETENEIQCYLSCGWRGMDDEVVIAVGVWGYDVLSGVDKVTAEIYKFTSAPVKVFRYDKLITDFTEPYFHFWKRNIDKKIVTL